MAKLFTITAGIRRLSQNAIDTMIDQLGKDCLLVFDSQETQCPNCIYDSIRKTSAGRYNGTGPVPFTRPPCPVCHGKGLIDPTPTTKVVRFLIDWQPKPWLYVDTTGTRMPDGAIRAKGYVSEMDSVLQCKHMIVDYKNNTFENNKFVLLGEPNPSGNIVANRYFTSLWARQA
jgi:hypothetical protein